MKSTTHIARGMSKKEIQGVQTLSNLQKYDYIIELYRKNATNISVCENVIYIKRVYLEIRVLNQYHII